MTNHTDIIGNRDIEFRAFIKDENRIEEVLKMDSTSVQLAHDAGRWRSKEDVVLMQYIGLKDKNRTKIFNGDIVKPTRGTFKGCTMIIVFDDTELCFYAQLFLNSKGKRRLRVTANKSFLVIGNCFQNPDLIPPTI